jgi:hypothetical protein
MTHTEAMRLKAQLTSVGSMLRKGRMTTDSPSNSYMENSPLKSRTKAGHTKD